LLPALAPYLNGHLPPIYTLRQSPRSPPRRWRHPKRSPKSLRSTRPEHPPVSGLVRVLSCCSYPPLVWRPNLDGQRNHFGSSAKSY
jgi:hypothetical protein